MARKAPCTLTSTCATSMQTSTFSLGTRFMAPRVSACSTVSGNFLRSCRHTRAAALDYIEGIGRPRIRAHEEALCSYAHKLLSSINSLRIIGVAEGKGPIVSFTMEGAHAHDIATLIDRSGVAVRAGTHCAMPLLQRFGVTSTCRASFALYNTFDEVDALAESLIRARKLFQ